MRVTTDRLILRDWQDEDFAPFLRHTNTPAVMRWLGGVMDTERAHSLTERLRGWSEELGHTFWAVQRKDDGGHLSGEILGFCGLTPVDLPGAPIGDFEIGWRLREDAWGHGYAWEAAEECLRLAFTRFGAPHVLALTTPTNAASWGLMQRLGMTRRTDLDFTLPPDSRMGGETIIFHAMTREQWEERRR
ncbi:GNAT family N-acetyltransferase [Croceicoccus sp. BE223]|uniref:GNAT family N-acetyltransferase n=1 Tax=Croceicoccus sp. BE223 TaxID=2817716 RepID=UPI0028652C08|nr:GNAT family N-acetyltransferase [Croceicoccus sp. BE223]MDR7102175.1 RimJ/RimL family protein N-acetyltransferase [Croceicoccus sp. BE223]